MNLQKVLEIRKFLEENVFEIPSTSTLFNQYKDNTEHDMPEGNLIRRQNLMEFVKRINMPLLFLVGEAPGYRGCRFSGVPFTCEMQFIKEELPFTGRKSSRKSPWDEDSAKVYWSVLSGFNMSFFTWNAVPFHPHEFNNPLSNRSPTSEEIKRYRELLVILNEILDPSKVIAVGRKAEEALDSAGIDCRYVRHPARGGDLEFSQGIRKIAYEVRDFIES